MPFLINCFNVLIILLKGTVTTTTATTITTGTTDTTIPTTTTAPQPVPGENLPKMPCISTAARKKRSSANTNEEKDEGIAQLSYLKNSHILYIIRYGNKHI